MLEVTDHGPSITEKDLQKIEKALRVKLPDDYKKQMLKTNGGSVGGCFTLKDGRSGSTLDALYSILFDDDDYDLVQANKNRKGRLPVGFVAIGPDPGGNEICIDCKMPPTRGSYGGVYFWDHDFEADRDSGMTPETAGNFHLIADNFTDFMNCLYELVLPESDDESADEPDAEPEDVVELTPEQDAALKQLVKRLSQPDRKSWFKKLFRPK